MISVLLALAAAASGPTDNGPIIVTGHAWAPFISPMGEPFRSKGENDDPLRRWFAGADKDGNGIISRDEMLADANRFFATLDEDGDGKIGPTEMMHYEWEIAPDVQMASRTRYKPGQAPPKEVQTKDDRKKRRFDDREAVYEGAARYGLLNLPQPVAAADYDFDRDVTLGEFRRAAAERFSLLDTAQGGGLTFDALAKLLPSDPGAKEKRKKDALDRRIGAGLPAKN